MVALAVVALGAEDFLEVVGFLVVVAFSVVVAFDCVVFILTMLSTSAIILSLETSLSMSPSS